MAGAGYKLFATGDVLTAAQVNTYLNEQTVMVFADSAARTTALSGVLAEGMMSYLQDSNTVEVYNGSNWVNVGNTGDVTEVQAGTGISVADGTGPIPIVTNTMATEIDAKGDLIVGTGDNTFDRLAVGTNEHRLVADSGETTGLKYVADTTNYAVAAKGDLLVGTAADTVAVLSVGTDGHTLVADSSVSPTGLKWAAPAATGFVGCKLYKSGVQSIANNTDTTITWNSEFFDTDGFHDNSVNNSRITIPAGKGGKYLITALCVFASNATGYRETIFYKNGGSDSGTIVVAAPVNGTVTGFNNSTILDLVATDYIELIVAQNSGGSLNFTNNSVISVQFLGA
jgi:hypothetical protein